MEERPKTPYQEIIDRLERKLAGWKTKNCHWQEELLWPSLLFRLSRHMQCRPWSFHFLLVRRSTNLLGTFIGING
ncbi:hypothetical protein LINPERHAP1_LOCUS9250 [Linum perenne]